VLLFMRQTRRASEHEKLQNEPNPSFVFNKPPTI
jgi:hypothetical protein